MIPKNLKYTVCTLVLLVIAVSGLVYLGEQEQEVVQGVATPIDEITDGKTIGFITVGPNPPSGLILDGPATSSPYTVTIPLGADGYRTGSFFFENMGNVTAVIHASNDSNASSTDQFALGGGSGSASSTRTFTDVTNDLIGAANFTSNRPVFLDTPIIARYLRFVFTSGTSATSSVRIKYVRSSK